MTPTPTHRRFQVPLVLLVLGTSLCLWPGLRGGFLFDDLVALPVLGASGRVDDWATLLRYVTSGTSDPTGRPIALLSFLLDARDWPADPRSFLVTNLLLHLLNLVLLQRLLLRLGEALGTAAQRNQFAAWLGAGLWGVHPLFVSTVFYVVQREAMLCATFVIAGLLAYHHGRMRADSQPGLALAWMAAGIAGGTTLAVLCKANGVLLSLLALSLEATIYRHMASRALRTHAIWRWLHRLVLVLPVLLLCIYIARLAPGLSEANDRAWSIGQRMLTEPRVLMDYLRLLAIPRALSGGLFNDAFPVSTGLASPPTTWLALLGIVGLAIAAFVLCSRAPAMAAGVLFFLAGHALESSVLPLELYYEHRNYLPAMVLFWPVARAVSGWQPRAAWSAALFLLAMLGVITWQRASLWSEPQRMALLWAQQHPGSSRAQAMAASVETASGRPEQAIARLEPLWHARPHDVQIALNHADAACRLAGIDAGEQVRITRALRNAREGSALVHRWLGEFLDGRTCPGVTNAVLSQWIHAAGENPGVARSPGRQQDMLSLSGRLALREGDAAGALARFDQALALRVAPEVAAAQAAHLGAAGFFSEGLHHLDRYETLAAAVRERPVLNMAWVHARVLDTQRYWPAEFSALRKQLQRDLAHRSEEVRP